MTNHTMRPDDEQANLTLIPVASITFLCSESGALATPATYTTWAAANAALCRAAACAPAAEEQAKGWEPEAT